MTVDFCERIIKTNVVYSIFPLCGLSYRAASNELPSGIPPPVEMGPAPMAMRKTIRIRVASWRSPVCTAEKPAVRAVTDWNKATSREPPSRSQWMRAPASTRTRLTFSGAQDCDYTAMGNDCSLTHSAATSGSALTKTAILNSEVLPIL